MRGAVRAACVAVALGVMGGAAMAGDGLRADAGPALEALAGTWASPAGEDWGRGAFGTREFTFADGSWGLRFVLALDPKMAAPVFQFRTQGTYDVQGPSSAVPGAFAALFREDAKFVTLLTEDPGLAQAFGLAGCGLEPGVEKDISVEGCAAWKPVAVCGEDHDLLAIDAEDRLFFGVRSADNEMCTADKRPSALLPPVLRR